MSEMHCYVFQMYGYRIHELLKENYNSDVINILPAFIAYQEYLRSEHSKRVGVMISCMFNLINSLHYIRVEFLFVEYFYSLLLLRCRAKVRRYPYSNEI